jgi:uncharacterized protein (TIGR03067 family)
VALGFVLSDTRGEDDATKEREALQGTWKVLKYDIADEKTREYIQKHGRVVIKGDKLTVTFVEEGRTHKVMEVTFKVSPAKTPRGAADLTIDFISILLRDTKDAKEILEGLKGKTILGVYALEGDTLKFFAEEEGERPKEFPKRKRLGVVTLQREKR